MALDDNYVAERTVALYHASNPTVVIDISDIRNILPYLSRAITEQILNAQVVAGQTVTGQIVVPGVGGGTYNLTNGKTSTNGSLE